YHEDMQALSSISQNRSRSSLIVTIQRESKQLRQLEMENKELKSALEEHQFALELIMSKYRNQVSHLLKSRESMICCTHKDNSAELISRQADKIFEMAAVMKKSVEIDEVVNCHDKQLLAQLKVENDGLREMLNIAKIQGSLTWDKQEKEVQTDFDNTVFASVSCLFPRHLFSFSIKINTTEGQRAQGAIASRCSGGKDDSTNRPLTCSTSSLIKRTALESQKSKSKRRWVPPSSIRRDALNPEDRSNVVFMKVRGILNKITPEKFNKLSEELINLGLDSTTILKGVILLVFEKALEEPKYSSMYAQLCRKLSEEVPNFEPFPSAINPNVFSSVCNTNTFCKLLLAKCRDEFEKRRKASEAFGDGPLSVDDEEQRAVAKHKMLGNIKFICELGKQNLVQESILHLCIQELCKKKNDESLQNKAEDLECLCQIMKTIGRLLDTEKAKSLMDQYFDRMHRFARSNELPSRIKFMLQDVLELRENKWVPRRVQREQNPKTINQIREEAAKDFGIMMPYPNAILPGYGYNYGMNSHLSKGLRTQQFNQHSVVGPGAIPGQRVLDDYYATPLPSYGPSSALGGPAVNTDSMRNQYSQASRRLNLGTQLSLQQPSPASSPPQMVTNNHIGQVTGHQNYSLYRGSHNSQEKRRDREKLDRERDSVRQQQNNACVQQQVTQAQSGSIRELPPRFQKKAMQQQVQQSTNSQQKPVQAQSPPMNTNVPIQQIHASKPVIHLQNFGSFDGNEISLRPAQNSMLKPNLSYGKQASHNTNANNSSIKNVDSQIYNKANAANKAVKNCLESQSNTRNVSCNQSNKEIIMKQTDDALNQFLSDKSNIDDIIAKMRDLKIPKNFQYDVLESVIKKSLDKCEVEREAASKFLTQLKNEKVIGHNIFITAFTNILNQLSDLESDVPRVKSHVAGYIARAVSDEILSLKEVFDLVDGGQHYPLFLLCLQQLLPLRGQSWLTDKFNESKINLMVTLPEIDRKKERLVDILKDRGLSFLYPLLRIEFDLWQHINLPDSTPSTLYRWIKDNVDTSLHLSPGFINVLFTAVAKFVTEKAKQAASEATFNEGQSPNNSTASVNDYEKDLLMKYKVVLDAFLHEKQQLQLVALYSLQSFCYDLGFPKGMLLRWFIFLYDMEVVEEEVFIKWKEDINEEYLGKGKALFQVFSILKNKDSECK
ncbi:eukaryotic translation initiation factor 4 gamma 2-like protein, partial [Leptotrombidium deliense]